MDFRYAQLDQDDICVSVSNLNGEVSAPNLIPIALDENPLGKRWDGNSWSDGPSKPVVFTFRDFFAHCYANGLTAAKYAEAKGIPALSIFFDMLQATGGIHKDDPFTVQGGEAFVAAGILTQAQRKAIFDNWPEA